jgi:adenylate cyclase
MDKGKVKSQFISNQMLLIGMSMAAIYWLLDSFLSLFLDAEETLLERVIGFDLNEIWMRIIVLCLFAIFGSHAQYIMNERRRLAEKAERDNVTRERFQRLLSPDLAERVVSGALTVEKGGESVEATVMFADIRGFTAISENTEAADVLQLLNEYYECIVDVVFQHEGTVDKFIGDAIMVIWGAPVRHDDDPHRAVKAAIEIQHALVIFNQRRQEQGKPPIQVGIGINTGELVAGYIGSSRTMSYSVIGDTVNTASRLCSAAKPGQIIISESTSIAQPVQIAVGPLQPIQAKGKYHPIEVFEVLGYR